MGWRPLVSRQIGAALGVAAMVAILGNPHGAGVLDAFRHAWTFAGLCLLAGGLLCVRLPGRRRAPTLATVPQTGLPR